MILLRVPAVCRRSFAALQDDISFLGNRGGKNGDSKEIVNIKKVISNRHFFPLHTTITLCHPESRPSGTRDLQRLSVAIDYITAH
jgi:hypothetical protein